jgi:hypothetical protein
MDTQVWPHAPLDPSRPFIRSMRVFILWSDMIYTNGVVDEASLYY